MKKKINLMICMLVLLFSFTGCARTEEQVEYDEAMMGQVTEFLVEYCANADEAVIEHWRGLSEFRLQQELAGAELPFTPESFLAALDSFEAGVEECGAYIEHDDFVYEASKDELRVTAEAQFEKREATLTFIYNEKLELESMTVDAKFTTAEILKKAGLNTLLGMGTVFSVLIFISLIISLFKYISVFENAFKKQPKATEEPARESESVPEEAAFDEADDTELAAVIAAAVAEYEGTTTDGFIVRSIRRRPSNQWKS